MDKLLPKLLALFAGLIVGKVLLDRAETAAPATAAPATVVNVHKHYVTRRPRKGKKPADSQKLEGEPVPAPAVATPVVDPQPPEPPDDGVTVSEESE